MNVELRQPTTDAEALRVLALDEPRVAEPLARLEDLAASPQPNNEKWVVRVNTAADELEAQLRVNQKLPAADEPDAIDELMNSIMDPDGTLFAKQNLAQPSAGASDAAATTGTDTLPGRIGTEEPRPEPRKVRETVDNERITEIERNVVRVRLSDIETRPDLFQTRDIDPGGTATGVKRVNELVRNFDINKFTPPKLVRNPEIPGRYIVRDGHHRIAAAAKVLGPDAEIPAILIDGDISDPAFLAQMREAGAASNFSRAEMNIREQARTVKTLMDADHSLDDIAARLRMSPI
ncbi:MAG: ParB-like nuclease domain-containing protein [Chloroflexi bacterium]|nr:ParB-like nuclease domain-containing protein [Chloroflexota bacterium]